MPAFQGAIFDVDGVLVDSPHETAWRESLDELMESSWRDIRDRTTWSPEAFTSRVYQEHVSGKPRASGARAALDYFHRALNGRTQIFGIGDGPFAMHAHSARHGGEVDVRI